MSKLATKYTPPKIDLKTALQEYEIEFARKDLTVLYSLIDTLESGVDNVSLKINSKTNNVEIAGNFKTIECRNVKAGKLSNSGYCQNKTDAKNRIETGIWSFPCPDYKYSNIKRNLEHAISEILMIPDCEVKSFDTNIVEFDINTGEDS